MAINAHDDARDTIAEIRSLQHAATDESLDVLIHALAELLRQHFIEEERRGGMFDLMSASKVDLVELGARIERRKLELMHDSRTDRGYDDAAHLDGAR